MLESAVSKYDPLGAFLAGARTSEVPLTFAEVEDVLGFSLPPYARKGKSWWSNNPGTHVGVRAWRSSGWRTSAVDLARERVTFVRDIDTQAAPASPGDQGDRVVVSLNGLTKAARDHLAFVQEDQGLDLTGAVAVVLNAAGRRALADWFAANAPKTPGDSVALIREDRDGR